MIRNVTMTMTIVPATAARPRKNQQRQSSVDQWNKVLLCNDVMDGFGLSIVDKGFG